MKKAPYSQRLFGLSPELLEPYAASMDMHIARFLADTKSPNFLSGQFLKNVITDDPRAAADCRDNDVEVIKAEATNPNISGGVLVPELMASEIVSILESEGVGRQNATMWPMMSDSEIVPRITGGFNAVWIPQNGTGTFTQPTFDGLTLVTNKLATLTTLSSELLEDGGEKLGLCAIDGIGRGLLKAEDLALFIGDGTSTYGGVQGIAYGLGSAGKVTAGANTFGGLVASDIANTIAALPARALPNAKIYISVTGYGAALIRLAGSSGGLVATIGPDGKLRANWHGLPVVFCQALPSSTASISGQMMLCVLDHRRQEEWLGEHRVAAPNTEHPYRQAAARGGLEAVGFRGPPSAGEG